MALALGACNSNGGGGGGGGGDPPDWAADGYYDCDVAPSGEPCFDDTIANDIRNSTEFANVDAFFGADPGNQSHPYALHNVHIALSTGFTGAGQMVAIVDDGFRTSHQEFDGKTIVAFGTLPTPSPPISCTQNPPSIACHGTAVAGLVGAIQDSTGTFGVAPGADLHLSSWMPSGTMGAFDIANTTAATIHAANLAAVAQNNSWGFDVSANQLASRAGPVAGRLNAIVGYGQANWQAYIDALNDFQDTGVIVWAMSNNENLANGDILGTLPYFEQSLGEAWITAVNGYFEVDGNGDIVVADRLSAVCGFAAAFCIAGDGTVVAPGAESDTNYYPGTGTSFVAPQIAASIAILAEAFPSLSPADWTDRLLITADNSWFDDLNVDIEGTLDLGGGVTHGYSLEWGHGVLDLEAALRPIQSVAILSGDTIATASRTLLDDGVVVATAGFGDGLQRALAGRDMAVFDILNGNFTVDAGDLVQSPQYSGLAALTRDVTAAAVTPIGTGFAYTDDLAGLAYDAGGLVSEASVLSLAADAAMMKRSADYGRFELAAFGFAGDHRAYGDALISGAGINASIETAGGGVFTVGLSQTLERGALLGLVGNDAFDFGKGSAITAANFGFTRDVGDRFSVFGNFELGVANALGATGNGLVASIDPATFNGFSVGASMQGVFGDNDQLTFSVSQPTRINGGAATIDLPVGRTIDGAIVTESVRAELAPTGRQLDFGLSYAIGLGENSQIRLGAQYSLDAGHIDGAKGLSVVLGYGLTF